MNKRALRVSFVMLIVLTLRLVTSQVLLDVRSVDVATIFAAGMAAGVLGFSIIQRRRATPA